ncbi:type I-C CRISPR-associated protein Cas7/Csd2 [Geotalea uraniireducens]|uniref:Type I-C CRISPR-associated protein Cas7/Csd2 n=1 Tax=Geotalea uraniireducens TaxID=351604 RepID=A0ABM8EN52_9BACT|nr:type I-C CRISPR-associated protein Cas7/Csd2 [Geotalea uraniireducens]BDV43648.1 type I-C CRISPR-associated protein Cas7/Csd2 [Geotalea uraniireducens]
MSLSKKIDFAVVFKVVNANPNGDPLNGNRPRTIYEGNGEVSDVCIKRKIRNRLMEVGKPIFVQSDDNKNDKHPSLKSRADEILAGIKAPEEIAKKACETWFDVRAFGQLFAFKAAGGKKAKGDEGGDDKGVSIGIRGPVSVQSAFSVSPVSLTSTQITKSVSSEGDGTKRGSDTMGMKHRVDRGIYTFFGSMNPQLAVKTGFSDEDAAAIKAVLPRLFENDASSARPEGSMEVLKVIWWEHNCASGQCSSAKVHRSLNVADTDDLQALITFNELDGLAPEIIDGI